MNRNIQIATLFIFLNKTCFSGLYQVNRKNECVSAFGKRMRPGIFDPDNIMAVHRLLQKVKILNGDYSRTLRYASRNTFYYLDPPYKPVVPNSFDSYTAGKFNDQSQEALRNFCADLTNRGSLWLQSNSDPAGDFFSTLYEGRGVHVDRITAKRSLNGVTRGKASELLISNYPKRIR